ncbi:blue copper protein 1a-like [Apium graveolens]|uniref:blue copper protein 1a-like n=1 Tax=Apium graveolens TaxID=4045 RepID=UPI003D793B99
MKLSDSSYKSWMQQCCVANIEIFKYSAGVHNVHRADLASFQSCTPSATSNALTTGNDEITLASEGKKWYLCSKATHCATGNMKLAITVLPEVESPAPPPEISAATAFGSSTQLLWIGAALAALMMMI